MIAQDFPGIAPGEAPAAADAPVLRRAVEVVGPPLWRGWTRIAGLALIGVATEPAVYLRLAGDGSWAAASWALVLGLSSMIGAGVIARAAIRRNAARRVGFDRFRAQTSAAPPTDTAIAAEPPA
jgi:hypothetical protein